MGLLGEELTAGDATRLAMSLEMLESEEQTPHEAGDKVAVQADPYGRAWVLQVKSQALKSCCLCLKDYIRPRSLFTRTLIVGEA